MMATQCVMASFWLATTVSLGRPCDNVPALVTMHRTDSPVAVQMVARELDTMHTRIPQLGTMKRRSIVCDGGGVCGSSLGCCVVTLPTY